MKKSFTTALFYLLSVLCLSHQAMATDLVVALGGTGGAYPSIGAAIAAASPNDRIIVYPQPNGAAYSEGALTITKSLQILSANEGGFYTVDGGISIAPSTAAISVTIIGMKMITGGIQTTINSPAGARSTINILNDSIISGSLLINNDNYNVTAASSYVGAGITIRYGKLLGNYVYGGIAVNSDGSVNNPTDTVMIIGNKVNLYTGGNYAAIGWASSSQYFSIQNNYILLSYGGNNIHYGILVTASKASLGGTNTILNNTVHKPSGTIYTAYSISTTAPSMTEFQNNLMVSALYNYAFAFSGGSFNAHYNYATTFNWTGVTNDGTNQTATNTVLNAEGLNTNALSNTVNGGTTDSAYVDLNLTRNDVGCYGGSYSLDNFFPISASDWARVILVTAPRRIMVNGTINVKAIGFDK